MYKNIKRRMAIVLAVALMIPYIQTPMIAEENPSVKTAKAEIISKEAEWNIQRLHAETSYEDSVNLPRIKVAVLDSGLDFSEDIPYVERKDFLGEEELHPLYQDYTGHGTSVASLICAKKNDDNITGIAANVDLYAARILDKNNEAPVERVIEAVKWAMEKKVNIIHMSFGTKEYSKEFEKIIEKAYNQGILIIASAGNDGTAPEDESTIEYPAAFEQVIAVGATNTDNRKTKMSATGDELNVVAPGEQILAMGHFEGVSVEEGTSISAAQVTGIAAVLWGKYPKEKNTFIRKLLLESANELEDDCGEGMVDYEQSVTNYGRMSAVYKMAKGLGLSEEEALETAGDSLDENVKKLSTKSVNYVKGAWWGTTHSGYVDNSTAVKNKEYIGIIKMGSVLPDHVKGMPKLSKNPYFHGDNNYLSNTQYIYAVARKYFNAGEEKEVELPKFKDVFGNRTGKLKNKKLYKKLNSCLENFIKECESPCGTSCQKNCGEKCNGKCSKECDNPCRHLKEGELPIQITDTSLTQTEINTRKGYAILGIALHNATDAFAHRGYRKINGEWVRIIHKKESVVGSQYWLWANGGLSNLLNEAAIADSADELSIRSTKSNDLVKKIINCFVSNKTDCYSAFKSVTKNMPKPNESNKEEKAKYDEFMKYRIQFFETYWEEVTGKKIKRKISMDTDDKEYERVNTPKNKDITFKVEKDRIIIKIVADQQYNYILYQKPNKKIVLMGKKKGKRYVAQTSIQSDTKGNNKFKLYVFNKQSQKNRSLTISATLKFSTKDLDMTSGKRKNIIVGYNNLVTKVSNEKVNKKGKKVDVFKSYYKIKTGKNKGKRKAKTFVGWSLKADGKIVKIKNLEYGIGEQITLFPKFVKAKKKGKKK